MDLQARIANYSAIESKRGRPLIVYATSTRGGVNASMAGDAVREFIDQIDAIPDGSLVDVLIHSTGGDALAAWKLMSLLRERFSKVGVLVPFMGFSAATLFALGADEIVMHPHASLGPIDPQITVKAPDGNMRQFAYEDIGAFLRFLTTEVKLTEQAHISAVIDRLFTGVDPLAVGAARRASDLSSQVGERLLSLHMGNQGDKERIERIATNLNKSFFAHGDAISRSRAEELELHVSKPDAELEALMWQAYLGIETHMEFRSPFDPVRAFLADPAGARVLRPVAPLNLPPNTPPQLAQQLWQQKATEVLQEASNTAPEVAFELIHALIESPRVASEFRSAGFIDAFRLPDGNVRVSVTQKKSQWGNIEVPDNKEQAE